MIYLTTSTVKKTMTLVLMRQLLAYLIVAICKEFLRMNMSIEQRVSYIIKSLICDTRRSNAHPCDSNY
jgi:hypothetical protein